ncbi:MAG: hypothetical protein HYU28_06375 [Actinobacteria bacterium]|nr:hypothetical protein [Actinomycetota bacterium]
MPSADEEHTAAPATIEFRVLRVFAMSGPFIGLTWDDVSVEMVVRGRGQQVGEIVLRRDDGRPFDFGDHDGSTPLHMLESLLAAGSGFCDLVCGEGPPHMTVRWAAGGVEVAVTREIEAGDRSIWQAVLPITELVAAFRQYVTQVEHRLVDDHGIPSSDVIEHFSAPWRHLLGEVERRGP